MPDFVVLGAQKSASTYLQDLMAQHPGIEMAAGEVRAFQDPFHDRGAVEALPGLFQGPPELVRGIKRPDYLGRPEVPARLGRHLPDARLLAVLRDPVARAISAYYHHVRHGFLPLLPLDEAFVQLLDGGLQARWPRAWEVLEYGFYARHLERYLVHFPRRHLLVLDQQNLVRQPRWALRRAFELVGVDPEFVPVMTRVANKGVYAPTRLRLLRSKNRVTHRYSEDLRWRVPRRPGPAGYAWNAGVVALDRLVLARLDSGRPPALPADLRVQLDLLYAPDQARLAQLEVVEHPGPGDRPADLPAW